MFSIYILKRRIPIHKQKIPGTKKSFDVWKQTVFIFDIVFLFSFNIVIVYSMLSEMEEYVKILK